MPSFSRPIKITTAAMAFVSVITLALAFFLPERHLQLYPHAQAKFSYLDDPNIVGAALASWLNGLPGVMACQVNRVALGSGCSLELQWGEGDSQITYDLSYYSHISFDIDFDGNETSLQFKFYNILEGDFDPDRPQQNFGQIKVGGENDVSRRYELDAFSVYRLWYGVQLQLEGANIPRRERVSALIFSIHDMESLGTRSIQLNSVTAYGRWLYPKPCLQTIALAWLAWFLFVGLKKISERHPNKIARLLAELEASTKEAEEANRDKLRFLSVASHDLRQPMHSLGFLIEELKYFEGKAVPDVLAQDFKRSHGYLIKLLDSLLDLSKIDAKAITPENHVFSVAELFTTLKNNYASRALDKGLSINIQAGEAYLLSAPQLLIRIMGNLLNNAIKYTQAGSIEVTCIVDKADDKYTVFYVRDTGMGIPREEVASIFEPFYQIHNNTREQEGGLGLGLCIVKRLADMLGITVRVTSTLGEGTCVSLRLKLADSSVVADHKKNNEHNTADNIGLNNDKDESEAKQAFSGLVVVVLENEIDTLDSVAALLRNWGCVVLASQNIAEAKAQAEDEEVHVVLSDYWLDDELGSDAINTIRALAGDDIPALIFTGHTGLSENDENIPKDVTVLYKPVQPSVLKQHLLRIYRDIIGAGGTDDEY